MKLEIKHGTHGTSSVITSGSSQRTNPPSDVTPASLLPYTAMSVTEVELGKVEGN